MSWVDPTVPAPGTDEEELLRPGGSRSRAGLVAAGSAALLVVITLLVVRSRHNPSGHRPLPTGMTTPSATASATRPDLVALPAGPSCPVDATCAKSLQLPVDTVAALYALMPDVAVVRSVSVLANRPGHFQPDLLSRRVDGAFDGGELVLRLVRTAGTGTLGAGSVARAQPTPLGASATGRLPGFVVTITVHGGTAAVRDRLHRPAMLLRLRHLVGDAALLEPQ